MNPLNLSYHLLSEQRVYRVFRLLYVTTSHPSSGGDAGQRSTRLDDTLDDTPDDTPDDTNARLVTTSSTITILYPSQPSSPIPMWVYLWLKDVACPLKQSPRIQRGRRDPDGMSRPSDGLATCDTGGTGDTPTRLFRAPHDRPSGEQRAGVVGAAFDKTAVTGYDTESTGCR